MKQAPDDIDWTDDTPLRLKDAATRAFPNGGMTPSGLRREAERGNLVIERIANKDYVTMKAIAEMRQRCRLKSKPNPAENWRARRSDPPDPLGRTPTQVAQDRALLLLDKRK
jgi:hypothetical protein